MIIYCQAISFWKICFGKIHTSSSPLCFFFLKPSYHRIFRLDGFDMQVVLHASGRAVVWYLVIPLDSVSVPRLVLAVLLRRRRPRRQVAALLLGDVGLRAVHRLDMLSERAGVCVALRAAGDLTYVGFLQIQKIYRYQLKSDIYIYIIYIIPHRLCLFKLIFVESNLMIENYVQSQGMAV